MVRPPTIELKPDANPDANPANPQPQSTSLQILHLWNFNLFYFSLLKDDATKKKFFISFNQKGDT